MARNFKSFSIAAHTKISIAFPPPFPAPESLHLPLYLKALSYYYAVTSDFNPRSLFFFTKVPTFPSLAKKKLHFSEKNLVSIINQPVDQSILYVIQLKSFVLREIKENFFFFFTVCLYFFSTRVFLVCFFFFVNYCLFFVSNNNRQK